LDKLRSELSVRADEKRNLK
jgi:23S rRNA G2445 N2-methylase RlmL